MLRRVAVTLCGVVLSLAALEFLVRLLIPSPISGHFFRVDERVGWAHIANSTGWWYGAEPTAINVRIRINSLGLRDREIPYSRSENAFRILTLGDSVTAGFQIPLEQTFQKILEGDLNRTRPWRQYQVINAGVNGYGTDNALLFYQHEGVKYQPDLVCLTFYLGNDIRDNYPSLKSPFSIYQKPYFKLEGDTLRLVDFPYRTTATQRLWQVAKAWLAPLQFYRLARQVHIYWRVQRSRKLRQTRVSREEQTRLWNQGWELTQMLLQEVRREVERHGSRLIVVIMPPPEAIDPTYWEQVGDQPEWVSAWLAVSEQEAALTDFLRREGFRFVPLTPVFKKTFERDRSRLYFYRDRHMNEIGHQLTAAALQRYLIEAALLPEPGVTSKSLSQTRQAGPASKPEPGKRGKSLH